jgi:hypothetical protein
VDGDENVKRGQGENIYSHRCHGRADKGDTGVETIAVRSLQCRRSTSASGGDMAWRTRSGRDSTLGTCGTGARRKWASGLDLC